VIEEKLEALIFGSRWLLAPLYVGLVGGIVFLVVKFVQEFIHFIPNLLSASETDVILAVLSLVDISLAGNLLVMVIFAGYENFVSKIDTKDSEDRPDWMGKVDYSGLKLKMIASIVAISAIQLLKAFLHVQDYGYETLGWMLGIHMAFVVSGVLLALMDRLSYPAAHAAAAAQKAKQEDSLEEAIDKAAPHMRQRQGAEG
jgi:uncharacterized protein (TIGR00645 family)